MKVYHSVQNLLVAHTYTHRETDRQIGDMISLLLFLECNLKRNRTRGEIVITAELITCSENQDLEIFLKCLSHVRKLKISSKFAQRNSYPNPQKRYIRNQERYGGIRLTNSEHKMYSSVLKAKLPKIRENLFVEEQNSFREEIVCR
jgi:hypothetical protein